MAPSKFTRFILRLLRYLVSLAGRSIKGLITLMGWTRQCLERNREKAFRDCSPMPSDSEGTEPPSNAPSDVLREEHVAVDVQHEVKLSKGPDHFPSHPTAENILLRPNNEYICPSYAPRAENDELGIRLHDRGADNGRPSTTRSASPLPSRPPSTQPRPRRPTEPPLTAPIWDSPSGSSLPGNDPIIRPMWTSTVQRWDRGVVV